MKRNKSIEISALRIFSAVADAETLTHAAQRLGITQSAVSQSIKQLEELTKVDLIVRRSRPIKLTQGGEVLKDYAQRVLSDTSRVMNDIRMASTGGLSTLGVGMVDSFGDALGLQFLSQIKPFVSKVALQTGLHISLSEALQNRDIDILITSDIADPSPIMERYALIRDPFLVIAPEASLPNQTENVIEIAKTLPFIHYLPNSRIGAQTDLIARRIGIELNTHYELDSTQTLVRFVQANHGWAIISALCLVRYPELLEGIRIINLNDGANARFISQLSRRNELGDMPEKFAEISRQLFNKEIKPQLRAIAPWLPEQAYTIKNFPSI
ncbi:MAG: LysR family transcriptional regulator [Pseudomonadota bacterium]